MSPGRICPGKDLALRTVYLVVACVLSVFDIGPALDDGGNPRMFKPEFDSITLRYVFLAPSVYTVEDVDRHATLNQGSKTFRV